MDENKVKDNELEQVNGGDGPGGFFFDKQSPAEDLASRGSDAPLASGIAIDTLAKETNKPGPRRLAQDLAAAARGSDSLYMTQCEKTGFVLR